MTDLRTDLIAFIREEVATADDPIDGDTDLVMTGLVDSLGVIAIVEWLEERFAIEIDPGDVVLEHFQTVDLMVAYVGQRAAA